MLMVIKISYNFIIICYFIKDHQNVMYFTIVFNIFISFFLFLRFFLYLFEDPLSRLSSDPFPFLKSNELSIFFQMFHQTVQSKLSQILNNKVLVLAY
jgi:hypothetical protein